MLRGTGQLATSPLQKFDFMLKAYQYIDYMSTSIEVTYDFIACIDYFQATGSHFYNLLCLLVGLSVGP